MCESRRIIERNEILLNDYEKGISLHSLAKKYKLNYIKVWEIVEEAHQGRRHARQLEEELDTKGYQRYIGGKT